MSYNIGPQEPHPPVSGPEIFPGSYTFKPGFGFVPQEDKGRSALRAASSRLGGVMLLYIFFRTFLSPYLQSALFLLLSFLTGGAKTVELQALIGQIALIISFLVTTLLPFYFYTLLLRPQRIVKHTATLSLGMSGSALFLTLGCSVMGGIAGTAVNTIFEWFGFSAVSPSVTLPASAPASLAYAGLLIVIVPLVEEHVFRGVILESLRPFGDGFAILVSSVLFALAHQNFLQSPNALLIGLLLGFFFVKTDSFWTSVIVHAVNNAIVLVLSVLSQTLPLHRVNLLTACLQVFYLIMAVLSLLHLCRRREFFSLPPNSYDHAPYNKIRICFTSPGMVCTLGVFAILFLLSLRTLW